MERLGEISYFLTLKFKKTILTNLSTEPLSQSRTQFLTIRFINFNPEMYTDCKLKGFDPIPN